jgi:hypothetical protein
MKLRGQQQMQLDGLPHRCTICGSVLTDPVSIHNGIGPECDKKVGALRDNKLTRKRGSIGTVIDRFVDLWSSDD